VVYQVVQQHLESWLAEISELDGGALPAYIERDFRRFLDCGILARGFGRAHCASCGHDLPLAFSCKGRGTCPSALIITPANTQHERWVYRPYPC